MPASTYSSHDVLLLTRAHLMWPAEEAAAWTVVQAGGRGKSGDQVELGQEEVDEELLVEVHNYQEPVAQGVVRAADLLQVLPLLPIMHCQSCTDSLHLAHSTFLMMRVMS